MPDIRPFNYGQAVAQGTQNAMAQMQAQAYPEQQRNAMRAADLQNRIGAIDYIAKSAPMVTPQNYAGWKADLEKNQIAAPGQLPEQYDADYINKLAQGAKSQLSGMAPSSVREYQYYQGLSPEQQKTFVGLKRSGFTLGGQRYGAGTDVGMGGPVVSAQETARGEAAVEEAKKRAQVKGQAVGETTVSLAQMEAGMPGVMDVVDRLKRLSDVASYRMTSQAFDLASKELGFGATKGATARSKMTSLVDNQILPLLRQTFGAAFTETEGARLRATMLDENATPEQKKATLDSFIDQKRRDIEAKRRELQTLGGQGGMQPAQVAVPQQTTPVQAPQMTQPAPDAAIQYLMQNDSPQMRQMFQAKYGYLPEGM